MFIWQRKGSWIAEAARVAGPRSKWDDTGYLRQAWVHIALYENNVQDQQNYRGISFLKSEHSICRCQYKYLRKYHTITFAEGLNGLRKRSFRSGGYLYLKLFIEDTFLMFYFNASIFHILQESTDKFKKCGTIEIFNSRKYARSTDFWQYIKITSTTLLP